MSDSTRQCVLVYDIGGSHVSAAVFDRRDCSLAGLSRAPLPANGQSHFSAASFGRLILALGESAAEAARAPLASIAGAGLAVPGPFDYAEGVSRMRHKFPALYGVDLKSALADRFRWQREQIRFVNDAAAFLLGEMGAGAAKGYSRAVGITLGTGIGCAFGVSDASGARILTEGAGVPPGGEIWNLPFPAATAPGSTVEDYVSTRFLRGRYQSLTGFEAEVSAIADAAGGAEPCGEVSAEELPGQPAAASDAHQAHCRARQAFVDFGRNLGLALKLHAAAFAPEAIVLGGGISRAANLFLPATRMALDGMAARLALSTLMDEAPLAGAGVHWFSAPS